MRDLRDQSPFGSKTGELVQARETYLEPPNRPSFSATPQTAVK